MLLHTAKRLLAGLLPVLIFIGCKDTVTNSHDDTIRGSGSIVSQTRTVDVCDGIAVKAVGKVYLTQAETQSIRIEADDNIINSVVSEKKNGVLVVGLPDGQYSDITLRIYVSMKNVNTLSIDGAGTIECVQPLTAPSLSCVITGAGTMSLSGQGNELACSIIGAGSINARAFTAKNCTAVVTGAGNCTVNCTDKLSATVNGVGSIVYYGEPPVVQSSVAGVGQITKGK
ncbi:MAG TPA: head GIN domain-containing protein [Bacteroidota bacterium]|nr:head GIN domain-containing protein [Bacteroidota bacterium]